MMEGGVDEYLERARNGEALVILLGTLSAFRGAIDRSDPVEVVAGMRNLLELQSRCMSVIVDSLPAEQGVMVYAEAASLAAGVTEVIDRMRREDDLSE